MMGTLGRWEGRCQGQRGWQVCMGQMGPGQEDRGQVDQDSPEELSWYK